MRDPELWAKIRYHNLDAAAGQATMASKLADAEGWTDQHAKAVLREYKRFVYLAMVSDAQVTPSGDVDRAWHLHLIYTRDYWDKMGALLPRPLHHEPSVSDEDAPRYVAQYEATKRLYAREFGQEPPVSVWPHAKAQLYVRRAGWFAGGCIGLFMLYAFVTGEGPVDLLSLPALLAIVGVCVYFGVWITFGAHGRRARGDGGGGSCGD
jgi:hypothetical protein